MARQVKTGFLEESPGVRSMARLAILACLLFALVFVALIVWYVLVQRPVESRIVVALTGALTAVVLNGAVAIIKRNGGTETDEE
jgi:hypothetical protein